MWTYRSMHGTEREAATNIARGEKSILVRPEKVQSLISISRARCRVEDVSELMTSAAAGIHETQFVSVSILSSSRTTGARMVSCWRLGRTTDNSGKRVLLVSPVRNEYSLEFTLFECVRRGLKLTTRSSIEINV